MEGCPCLLLVLSCLSLFFCYFPEGTAITVRRQMSSGITLIQVRIKHLQGAWGVRGERAFGKNNWEEVLGGERTRSSCSKPAEKLRSSPSGKEALLNERVARGKSRASNLPLPTCNCNSGWLPAEIRVLVARAKLAARGGAARYATAYPVSQFPSFPVSQIVAEFPRRLLQFSQMANVKEVPEGWNILPQTMLRL